MTQVDELFQVSVYVTSVMADQQFLALPESDFILARVVYPLPRRLPLRNT